MGDERPSSGAAGNGLHHGRFHLHEAPLDEESANVADDPGAHLEHPPGVRVHDQVQVALPVADFGVGQSVELLGQRAQVLCEQLDVRRLDRQLALVGAHHGAAHAHDVADVPQIVEPAIGLRTQIVLPQIALDLTGIVLQRDEAGLAHHAAQHHPSGHCRFDALALERGLVEIAAALVQLLRHGGSAEIVGVGTAGLRASARASPAAPG